MGIAFISLFVAVRSITILSLLNPLIASFISHFNPASLLRKAIGKELMPAVATVERSITAHIRNRLAWMSTPATNVLVIIFLRSHSLLMMFLMIDRSTSATNVKFAKNIGRA